MDTHATLPEEHEGEGGGDDAPPAQEREASEGEASAAGGGEQEDGAEQSGPGPSVARVGRSKRKRAVVCSDDEASQEVDAHGFSVQETETAMRHSFVSQSSPDEADKSAGPSGATAEPDAEEEVGYEYDDDEREGQEQQEEEDDDEEATDDEGRRHATEVLVARRAVRAVLGIAHSMAAELLENDGPARRADRRYELVKEVARQLEATLLPDEPSELE